MPRWLKIGSFQPTARSKSGGFTQDAEVAAAGTLRGCRRFERRMGRALHLRGRCLRQECRGFTDGVGQRQEVVRSGLVGS
jgi:hypothetical protein